MQHKRATSGVGTLEQCRKGIHGQSLILFYVSLGHLLSDFLSLCFIISVLQLITFLGMNDIVALFWHN